MVAISNLLARLMLLCFISMATLFAASAETKPVHLVNTGWHVGLILPVDIILKRNLPESRNFPNASFIEIGWGDKRFYQSKSPSVTMAFNALFTPTPPVMHIYGFENSITNTFRNAEILEIPVPAENYSNLLSFIHRSFIRNANGTARPLGKGLYGLKSSQFYSGNGKFHLFNTCNTWVADALNSGGLNINPQSVITADNLLDQARQAIKLIN